MAAHAVGARRAAEVTARYGLAEARRYAEALLAYTERMVRALLASIPPGAYAFEDFVEAPHGSDLPIQVTVTVSPATAKQPEQRSFFGRIVAAVAGFLGL